MLKILVVDDHPLILKGLSDFLVEKIENCQVYSANNGFEAIDILSVTSMNIVILDLTLPKMSGIETLRKIKSDFLNTKVLVMDFGGNFQLVKEALMEGASGFVSKEFALSEVETAIDEILKGNFYYQKEVNDALLGDYREYLKGEMIINFTNREKEVLKLICNGLSSKEIAANLFISPRTVEGHKKNLMEKTGASNTILLVRHAIENKLV